MTGAEIKSLRLSRPEREVELLKRLRERYPDRSSRAGLLYAEILRGTDPEQQKAAVYAYEFLSYRRGFQSLEKLRCQLATVIEKGEDFRSERMVHYVLCELFGKIDTPYTHDALVRSVETTPSAVVRGHALDGLALEESLFDLDYMLSKLPVAEDEWQVLAILYALNIHEYARLRPEEARVTVEPYLRSESSKYRWYAIQVLACNPENRELVRSLADDPNKDVRIAVVEAHEFMDRVEKEPRLKVYFFTDEDDEWMGEEGADDSK